MARRLRLLLPAPPWRVPSVSRETPLGLVSQEPRRRALQLLPAQGGLSGAARPQPPWSRRGQLCRVTPRGRPRLIEGDTYTRAWGLFHNTLQPESSHTTPPSGVGPGVIEQETAEGLTYTHRCGSGVCCSRDPLPEGALSSRLPCGFHSH